MMITMDAVDLTQDEINFIKTRKSTKQLAFALLFKFYQESHKFLDDLTKIPANITNKLAHLLNVPPIINKISLRTYGNYISLIRKYFKTSFSKKAHYKELEGWIKNKILPTNHITEEEIEALAIHYLKERGIESFKEKTMTRIILDATNAFENELFETLKNSLSPEDEAQLNGLLLPYKDGLSYLGWINKEINNPSLDSMLVLMEQLSILNRFNFDLATIRLIPRKRILHYSDAFTRLNPSDLKQITDNNRCAHLRIHSHIRNEQLTDKIIDVFNRIIRNVIHKSEKRVVKKLINEVKKIYGKDTIRFNIAEAYLEQPDGTIRDKIFPIVGQDKLKNIIDEYKKKGPKYQSLLHQQIRSSYASYYRRMIQPLLENVVFCSNNSDHQPILNALALIKKYFDSNKVYFPDNEDVPMDCLPDKWQKRIVDAHTGKIKRICYEVYVLNKLADRIRCREIWIDGSLRLEEIWGGMPIAVASDSTQFSAYFQNLISEYHHRYGGRGVMIYWHVEKNACCIHSQLKSVSSSEVSAMIEGVLRHCTEMSVQKNYVDTHGQSEVGFAFSYLLGFSLMPRLANLNKQRLAQCELGDYQQYKNLQSVLTDTINWQLSKEQYSQIVKYTAAMKAGHADPESILRRFNQNNLKHPTYMALSQLGKVLKTIFICNYLMHESIRQEIQEGLNVVELWNGVSKFIFYGRAGEISSNHEKAQTLSVMSLHLLQLSMVYINTLIIQQIIEEHGLKDILTKEDKRALTPLIYEHVNPYGLFPLDLSTRLPHLHYKVAA